MAYDLVIGEEQIDLASIQGWREFREWADSLPRKYRQIHRLADKGKSSSLSTLREELESATQESTPNEDVLDIALNVAKSLRVVSGDVAMCYVTDGFGKDDGSEDEWVVTPD